MTDQSIAAGFSLLRNPNVSKMFVAYLVSYSGTAMAPIAALLPVLVLAHLRVAFSLCFWGVTCGI